MNGKTKTTPRRKYSKGWAILSDACRRTKVRRMSEGLVGQCILARRLSLAFSVGREVWGMAEGCVLNCLVQHQCAWQPDQIVTEPFSRYVCLSRRTESERKRMGREEGESEKGEREDDDVLFVLAETKKRSRAPYIP